jgi:chromate transporter
MNMEASGRAKNAGPSPFGIFLMLAKINALTLGGGYVIVPVMAVSLEKKGWMKEKDFYDIFARAQAFPGPLALSSALLVSKTLCGAKGMVAAFLGVLVPPFFSLILVGSFIGAYGSLPAVKRFLEGAGAVVPGIVAALIYKNATKRKWTLARAAQTLILTLVLVFFPRLSLPLLLAGIVAFYGVETLCRPSK